MLTFRFLVFCLSPQQGIFLKSIYCIFSSFTHLHDKTTVCYCGKRPVSYFLLVCFILLFFCTIKVISFRFFFRFKYISLINNYITSKSVFESVCFLLLLLLLQLTSPFTFIRKSVCHLKILLIKKKKEITYFYFTSSSDS